MGNYEDENLHFRAPSYVKDKRFGEGGRYDLLEPQRITAAVGSSDDSKLSVNVASRVEGRLMCPDPRDPGKDE